MAKRTQGFPYVRSATAGDEYVSVPTACNMVLGASGNKGDYLEGVVCVVNNSSLSGVSLIDGTNNAVSLLPNNVGGGIGSYPIPCGWTSSNGAWRVVTNNGVSVIASGDFE